MSDPSDISQNRRGFLWRHRLALLATLLVAVTIGWGMLTPTPPTPDLMGPLSDKLYHVMAFAGLVFPTALLYARSLVCILPLAALFGGAIELVQPYMGRAAEVADALADLAGLALGTVTGLALRAWLRRYA